MSQRNVWGSGLVVGLTPRGALDLQRPRAREAVLHSVVSWGLPEPPV